MKEVLEKHLEKVSYEPTLCSDLSKTIVSEIKLHVKELDFERYKVRVHSSVIMERGPWG